MPIIHDKPSTEFSDKLRAEVRKRAKRSPSFIYKAPTMGEYGLKCVYLNKNGTGSCLIGRAALGAGVPREVIKIGDTASDVVENTLASDALMNRWEDFDVDQATALWCREIQSNQDNGLEWGYCVSRADQRYPRVADRDRELGVLAA